ncbi:hypothetical protein GPK34_00535 [Secundilactobacillus kimchicus]|uniref:hypothetical protein n=1 Tax=Secundilactobacillus kimchicus TaxID=528209 RepID=UPI001C015146|nr:hypothetical protein [Secundilactobacillus kimchicus]MBT9670524.1 hypothetical protein [Secundilactobacillus kimchicus]
MAAYDFSDYEAVSTIKYRDYDGSIKEMHPKEALSFNGENIPYETQAITYFMVAQLLEQANLNLENSKVVLRRKAGELYNQFVVDEELVKRNNGKKPTDAMINSAINADDDYVKLNLQVNQLQTKYSILKDLFKAFEQRKDLMQSLSAQKRAEYNIGSNTVLRN